MKDVIISIGFSDRINDLFKRYFSLDSLKLYACNEIGDALILLEKNISYCLIILDASPLPIDIIQEAVSKLRQTTYIPLLVICTEEASASTLEVGADVCLSTKSNEYVVFSQAMALIRRYTIYNHFDAFFPDHAILYRGDLMVDSMRHRVTVAGKEIQLLPREFRLLAYFVRNPGIALTQEQLGHAIWLSEHDYNRDVMKVISDLRHKLSDEKETPKYIETLRGVGYRFIPQE